MAAGNLLSFRTILTIFTYHTPLCAISTLCFQEVVSRLSFKVFQNSLKILHKPFYVKAHTSGLYHPIFNFNERLILQRFPYKVNEHPYTRPTVGDKIKISPSKSALNDLVAAKLNRNVLHGRTIIRLASIELLCNHIPRCFHRGVDYTLSLHWSVELLRPTSVSL